MKTISDHILDILQNSTRASATRVVLSIEVNEEDDLLVIVIEDNGAGISPGLLSTVTHPFTTTRKTRKVGLGLPLLRQHAELAGGALEVESEQGRGTIIRATFRLNNLDRQPMGDLASTVTLFITGNPGVDLIFSYKSSEGRFDITGRELAEALEDDDLSKPVYFGLIRELLGENLTALGADRI
jgi:hypothetical protein